MPWNDVKDWLVAEPLTADDMNDYVSANLEYLFTRNRAQDRLNEASDYTTTSTTFSTIDATTLSQTITTYGGDVLVCFVGSCQVSNSVAAQHGSVFFELLVDGAAYAGNDGLFGLCSQLSTKIGGNASFSALVRGLSAGSHTFRLRWKVAAASGTTTATLFAGAGTSQGDVHPEMFAVEI